MKSFPFLTGFLCWWLCANVPSIEAGRLASMQVVQRLKDIEPKHAHIKYRIINYVYSAKSNVVQRADAFYQLLFAAKERSLAGSIVLEDDLLFQLDHQPATADRSCLGMLRTIVDSNMNVAGVGYTNCVNAVEVGLERELQRAQALLEVDESTVFYQSLLDVFEGENIVAGPERILGRLQTKADEIDAFASDFMVGMFATVEQFASALWDLRNAYQSCLATNEFVLQLTYGASKSQLTSICLGTIVASQA